MNAAKYFIEILITWLVPPLMSNQFFSDRFLDELKNSRPRDLARKADLHLVLREQGDKVLDALSDRQNMAVLERLCAIRLADVITTINSKPGGSFKYVGDGDIRVIIGSGSQKLDGWLATDIDKLNIVEDASWRRLFNPGSIDRLLAEHVFEHLSLREFRSALEHVYKYLKPGGLLRLAVPDAFHPSRYYYNLVKPGGWETPYEHMLFLDHEMLSRIGSEVGFEVRLLEYFDEKGIFHDTGYKNEDGIIQRCARNDSGLDINNEAVMAQFHASIPEHLRQQFVDRQMAYTSLIVDLVKPK